MLGPYYRAKGVKRWRVIVIAPDGTREETGFARKATAEGFAQAYRAELPQALTVSKCLGEYREALQLKGNKDSSIGNTLIRLGAWFDGAAALESITPQHVAAAYRARQKTLAASTHRAELAEVKTWLRWCKEQRWILRSPAEDIKPVGRVKHGKKQLRASEARRLSEHCLERGDDLAVAVLCCLWLGLRSGEVRQRVARDVDDAGGVVWLWIDATKTEAGKRRIEVPEPLAGLLQARAERKGYLFPSDREQGYRGATWLRKGLAGLCRAAGVEVVCPHGLRGTHATLARQAGVSGRAVAATLGHGRVAVTEQSYVAPGVSEGIERGRALRVIQGGR